MLGKGLPVLAVLFDQDAQAVVLGYAPALLRLVAQSSPPAIAHLSVSTGNEGGDLLEASILICTQAKQESVLFFSPSLFGLFVALLEEILLANGYSPGEVSALSFIFSVNLAWSWEAV